MITQLALRNFKSFEQASLPLGRFSVIIGTNASGKSNVREALRFLHGIARGYSLADTIGEKWIEGGVQQWKGIRGGAREASYQGLPSFSLGIDMNLNRERLKYGLVVAPGKNGQPPLVVSENLRDQRDSLLFEASAEGGGQMLRVDIRPGGSYRRGHIERVAAVRPALAQIPELVVARRKDSTAAKVVRMAKDVVSLLASMRFLDVHADAMRQPSVPGQTVLGDRGENLSSVLQATVADPQRKDAVLQWVRGLTPMDAVDFEFPVDGQGRVLLTLVEGDGRRTSAYSASDGTLRFLAMVAALLGPEPARLYFFEELENGIHPTRLHLLLQLIEQCTQSEPIQVVATTHSPQLLAHIGPNAMENVSLAYRFPGANDTRIKRVMDIPPARELFKKQDAARLLASGWFENAVTFLAPEEKPQ